MLKAIAKKAKSSLSWSTMVSTMRTGSFSAISRNIFVKTLRKKDNLFGIVIPKVYFCHVIRLYHKDTKFL